jgi:hypothetical protein
MQQGVSGELVLREPPPAIGERCSPQPFRTRRALDEALYSLLAEAGAGKKISPAFESTNQPVWIDSRAQRHKMVTPVTL